MIASVYVITIDLWNCMVFALIVSYKHVVSCDVKNWM